MTAVDLCLEQDTLMTAASVQQLPLMDEQQEESEFDPADVTDEETPAERGRSLRRAAMLTAGAGVAHAVLFVIAIWLLSTTPGFSATDQEIVDYYASGSQRAIAIAGLYVMPFSGIAFLWFIVALRMWTTGVVRRENVLLSNLQLVSGIIYVGLTFTAAAAISVTAAGVAFDDNEIDPDFARQFPQYGMTLLTVFAIRMAAVFVITTSNIGRTAGILPRWFSYAGFVFGVFMLLSVSLAPFLSIVFPIWLFTLSAILMIKARQIPKELRLPPRAGVGMTNPFGAFVPGQPPPPPPKK